MSTAALGAVRCGAHQPWLAVAVNQHPHMCTAPGPVKQQAPAGRMLLRRQQGQGAQAMVRGRCARNAQVSTPASPTRKLLEGESAAPGRAAKAAPAQDKALPTDPADVWLQSYGPCEALHSPSTCLRHDDRCL